MLLSRNRIAILIAPRDASILMTKGHRRTIPPSAGAFFAVTPNPALLR